jgi:hypothetical protein
LWLYDLQRRTDTLGLERFQLASKSPQNEISCVVKCACRFLARLSDIAALEIPRELKPKAKCAQDALVLLGLNNAELVHFEKWKQLAVEFPLEPMEILECVR